MPKVIGKPDRLGTDFRSDGLFPIRDETTVFDSAQNPSWLRKPKSSQNYSLTRPKNISDLFPVKGIESHIQSYVSTQKQKKPPPKSAILASRKSLPRKGDWRIPTSLSKKNGSPDPRGKTPNTRANKKREKNGEKELTSLDSDSDRITKKNSDDITKKRQVNKKQLAQLRNGSRKQRSFHHHDPFSPPPSRFTLL
jgi:hypothetical protein